MPLTRRAFSASVASAPLLRGIGAKAADSADVVIAGGGLAGLNAAWILSEAGYDVVVLEGASRFGGRVWSATEVETKPELGASQIGPAYARVLDAVDRLDLKLIGEDRDILPFTYHLGGQMIRMKDWPDHPANRTVGAERAVPPLRLGNSTLAKLTPFKELDDWLSPEYANYDVSLDTLFQTTGMSAAGRRLAALSQDLHGASALAMMQEGFRSAYEAKFGSSGPVSMPMRAQRDEFLPPKEAPPPLTDKWPKNIAGGTWQLPKAMAARLKRPVMTDKVVVAIDMDDAGVDVRCLDGSSVRAKYVISGLPFSTLRNVVISPAPDPLHRTAITEIGYVETTRAFGLVKEPFWQEDGFDPSLFTESPLRMMWTLDNHKNGKGPYRCMFVMTGTSADQFAWLSPDRGAAAIIAELERIRPAARGQVKILKFHSWGRQPFQGGCRHMFRPGQITAFGVDMIRPWHRLHFAGEHTRRLEYGMEAALESGERAAQEVLALL